jgi:uncharacterized protein (DUF952 family)
MSIILHLTTRLDWEQAQATGAYRSDTLDTQGFIHCSTPNQMAGVANRFFRGQTGLVLLCIETEKVQPQVIFEHPINPDSGEVEPGSEEFPHIYGALNLDSVVQVVDFPPNADGTFILPAELRA